MLYSEKVWCLKLCKHAQKYVVLHRYIASDQHKVQGDKSV